MDAVAGGKSNIYQRLGYLADSTESTCLHLEAGLYIAAREPERALQFACESPISPCTDDGIAVVPLSEGEIRTPSFDLRIKCDVLGVAVSRRGRNIV